MLHYFKDTCIECLWLPNLHVETLISKRNWVYVIKEWSRRPSPLPLFQVTSERQCVRAECWLSIDNLLLSRPWTSQFPDLRNEFLLFTGPWSIVSLNSTIKEQYERCFYQYRSVCIMRHRTLKPVTTPFRDLLCISERSQKWQQNRYWCPRTGVCSLTKFLFQVSKQRLRKCS